VPLVAAVVVELEKIRDDPKMRPAAIEVDESSTCRAKAAATTDDLVFPWDMTRAWRTALRRAGPRQFSISRPTPFGRAVARSIRRESVGGCATARPQDIRMTQRYSHIHSEHTIALVDRVMGEIA